MSAFIVSDAHIHALVTAGLTGKPCAYGPMTWHWPEVNRSTQYEAGQPWGKGSIAIAQETKNELTRDNADQVGQMLLKENYKSINHRYAESEDHSNAYTYKQSPRLSNVELLKLLDCYEYQSCEHREWDGSEAKKFCKVLRKHLITGLLGYDAAKWSI